MLIIHTATPGSPWRSWGKRAEHQSPDLLLALLVLRRIISASSYSFTCTMLQFHLYRWCLFANIWTMREAMAHLPDHSQSIKTLPMYIHERVYVLNKPSKVFNWLDSIQILPKLCATLNFQKCWILLWPWHVVRVTGLVQTGKSHAFMQSLTWITFNVSGKKSQHY